jgi:L-cysteine desulfidase
MGGVVLDISRYLRSLYSNTPDPLVDREVGLASWGDLWALVPHLTQEEEEWILERADQNYRLAQRGVLKPRGRALGYRLWRGSFDEDPIWVVRAMCGAALDFALSDPKAEAVPLRGCVASGVLLTVPLTVICNYLSKDRRALAEAMALGGLVGCYITSRLDGRVGYDLLLGAAAGCAAGLAKLSDGSIKVVERASATAVCLTLGDVGDNCGCLDYLASVLAGQAVVACQMALSGQGFGLSMDEARGMFEHWARGRESQ